MQNTDLLRGVDHLYSSCMQAALIVFVGAGLGGVLRHAVNQVCGRLCGVAFPWGTLTVNLTGSFAMGLIVGWLAMRSGTQSLRLFLTTGIMGGFTTFSAFSLDSWLLWERGEAGVAAAYIGLSVAGAIAALGLGLVIARALT